jgi:hypothetical protein
MVSTMKKVQMIHVGSGIYALDRVQVDSSQMPEQSEVDYSATLVIEGLRYVVEELALRRSRAWDAPAGPPITGELIRKIPVQRIVTVAAMIESGTLDESGEVTPLRFTDADIERLVKAGATDETLLAVAQIYVTSALAGDPPARSVREVLGIPASTANVWIRRAKDRGFLDG